MDIAMIFDGLQVGGIERVGASYARLLRELGHTVTVVNLDPALTVMEAEFPADCAIERCPFPKYRAPEARAGLIRYGFSDKLAYPFRYAAAAARNALERPAVRKRCPGLDRTFDVAIAFSGHFNDLAFLAHGFVKAKHTAAWLHGALYQYALLSPGYLELYRRIRNLVVLTEDAQEEVLSYFPDLDLNIRKMYNPTFIAGDAPDPAAVAALREEYGDFLLMAARFSYPHKDHYTVLEAFRRLRTEYGDQLELVFAGDGPEEEKVRAFADALGPGTAEHVHFAGVRKDMRNLYEAAHILVHASVAGEGLPTVMLEALAFRLPMVATDSKVGPREILEDGEYGLLCRVKDPADMAEKLHRLHSDGELYRRFRDRSPERLAAFTPERIRAQLEDWLADITASSPEVTS